MEVKKEVPTIETKVELLGGSGFHILKVQLAPNKTLIVEPGAMACQDSRIDVATRVNGGFFSALLMKFLGQESFFINDYRNPTTTPLEFYLSQSTPGEIIQRELNGETLYLQAGSFIARTSGVQGRLSYAGFASLFAGEGLFRLAFSGKGRVWYGSYGGVVEKEIVGDYIVDSGHLLSYPPTIKLSLRLAGGWISSFLSQEGFVLKLKGEGKIQLQTRSVKGLAQWLNPRFWG